MMYQKKGEREGCPPRGDTNRRCRGCMRKLMILTAMLAMVLAASVPAMGQAGQGFEEESESGDVSLSFSTTNEGNNSSVCAPAEQFGNSGNLENEQGVLQYVSTADDIGFGGASESFGASLETECSQQVQQSSAASSS
jgi:multidrug efflux pump subunit AcrB